MLLINTQRKHVNEQSSITVNNLLQIVTILVQLRFSVNFFGSSDVALTLDGTHKHTGGRLLMLILVCISIPGAEPIK